jgi:hypothetical protein
MTKPVDEDAEERGGIVAFRAPADLIARVDEAAAAECISRSDVARRALVRDLDRAGIVAAPAREAVRC